MTTRALDLVLSCFFGVGVGNEFCSVQSFGFATWKYWHVYHNFVPMYNVVNDIEEKNDKKLKLN